MSGRHVRATALRAGTFPQYKNSRGLLFLKVIKDCNPANIKCLDLYFISGCLTGSTDFANHI